MAQRLASTEFFLLRNFIKPPVYHKAKIAPALNKKEGVHRHWTAWNVDVTSRYLYIIDRSAVQIELRLPRRQAGMPGLLSRRLLRSLHCR